MKFQCLKKRRQLQVKLERQSQTNKMADTEQTTDVVGPASELAVPVEDIPVMDGDDDWIARFNEPTPLPAVIYTTCAIATLLILQTIMVNDYAKDSKDLKIGDVPVW